MSRRKYIIDWWYYSLGWRLFWRDWAKDLKGLAPSSIKAGGDVIR